MVILKTFYVLDSQILGFDFTRYPNVAKWLENAKKVIPGYNEINHAGCLDFKKLYDMLTQK